MSTTVTGTGQVTIPQEVQDFLGIGPGSEVEFKRSADGQVVLAPANDDSPAARFARFVGHAKGGLSTDEIMSMTRGDE